MQTRYVESHDGTRIAVYEDGTACGPTVVLVHGWPDSHVLWDGVVAELAPRYRVIRYDNRGAGASDVPKPVDAYAIARLADDFDAVTAAMCPGEKVHVIGHDWGAATMWEYLNRPSLGGEGPAGRVASYTSISGPDPGHLSRFIRDGLARPYRPRRFARALSQAAHFSYMIGFSIPVLAPWALRTFLPRLNRLVITTGVPRERRYQGPTFIADAANGLKIYRANFLRALARPGRAGKISVPVQLLVNTRDNFVRPWVYDDTARWVPRLWRRDLPTRHWLPMSNPELVAGAAAELIDHLEGGQPSGALLRAEVGR